MKELSDWKLELHQKDVENPMVIPIGRMSAGQALRKGFDLVRSYVVGGVMLAKGKLIPPSTSPVASYELTETEGTKILQINDPNTLFRQNTIAAAA